MALRNFKRKKQKKNKPKRMHRKEICTKRESERKKERRKEKERKKTGSVYRIVKSSTIYTASFKTQMSSTI